MKTGILTWKSTYENPKPSMGYLAIINYFNTDDK